MSDQPTDDDLRRIARNAVPSRVYSGNVLALRAVYDAATERAARIAGDTGSPFADAGVTEYAEAVRDTRDTIASAIRKGRT